MIPYIYTQLRCKRCSRWFDRGDYDNYNYLNCGKEIPWIEKEIKSIRGYCG